ncbi:TIGR02466 family protein [Salinisphaera hydrothermalis]|uniref:TIGR02466 family protein n=1 Tax=Salinisphaera hydrothermalis TaxID=563188 RepID=UPI003340905F
MSDSELDMQVGHFFATPVAATLLDDSEARNAELKERILAERAREGSISASNLGGWHSGRPVSEWAGPRMEEVLAAARQMANRLTMDRSGQSVRIDWSARAWANINEYGHANEFHYHPGVYWSGTYYVDDGGRASDASLGGEFEIMDPRGPGVAMYAPSLVFRDGGHNTGGTNVQFTPRAGLLMLFPGWLHHQVRPYLGSTQRISIAFNLSLGDNRTP